MVYRAPPSKAPLFAPPRHIREVRCWSCGTVHPPIYALDENNKPIAPQDNEVFRCTCLAWSIFDSTIKPDGARKPSPREMDEILSRYSRMKN